MPMPLHKPNDSDAMENHHYAAILASALHCHHTCARGLEHASNGIHEDHDELHTYPDRNRVNEILDNLNEDFKAHVDNLPPHFRAAYCNAHAIAKWHINGPEPY